MEYGQVCALPGTKTLIEARVLYLISCGMYIVSSKKGDKLNGQTMNSLMMVTSDPPRIGMSMCRQHLTHEYIQDSKVFSVSILSTGASKKFIADFGFKSGRQINKFQNIEYKIGKSGAPIVLENTVGYIDCQLTSSIDVDSHTFFIGQVIDAELLKKAEPMTYAYYCEVMRGKTPITSPMYICAC